MKIDCTKIVNLELVISKNSILVIIGKENLSVY